MSKKALMIGRVAPTTRGHGAVIRSMEQMFGSENCFFGIGSSNHELSIRHLFSYEERRDFFLKLFPNIRVFGVPDYPTDQEWMTALNDTLRLSGTDLQSVTIFGGCEEDVEFFYRQGLEVEIMNRFDGTTPKVSATEVRDALIRGKSIKKLVDPLIVKDVEKCFKAKWELLRKM